MSFTNSRNFNRLIVPASFLATVYGGITVYKESKYKPCPSKDSMKDKLVVVTGANSGIGYETTKGLADRGAAVIMGCRHMGKCKNAAKKLMKETGNSHIVCRFLDLANLDSVEEFAATVRKEVPHLDVLINNAGVMKPRPPKTTPKTDDGFERQLGTNHIGHFLLTNLLMERLTNGETPGRVINVTSVAFKQGKIDFDDINRDSEESEQMHPDERLTELYYQSKLANVVFTRSLHDRLQKGELTNVRANCVHPGIVATNIGKYANVPIYAQSGDFVMKPIKFILLKTARQGAQTSIYLASDESLDEESGKYYEDCEALEPACDLCEEETSERLWSMSEQWSELKKRLARIEKKEQAEEQAAAAAAEDSTQDSIEAAEDSAQDSIEAAEDSAQDSIEAAGDSIVPFESAIADAAGDSIGQVGKSEEKIVELEQQHE